MRATALGSAEMGDLGVRPSPTPHEQPSGARCSSEMFGCLLTRPKAMLLEATIPFESQGNGHAPLLVTFHWPIWCADWAIGYKHFCN